MSAKLLWSGVGRWELEENFYDFYLLSSLVMLVPTHSKFWRMIQGFSTFPTQWVVQLLKIKLNSFTQNLYFPWRHLVTSSRPLLCFFPWQTTIQIVSYNRETSVTRPIAQLHHYPLLMLLYLTWMQPNLPLFLSCCLAELRDSNNYF